MKAYIDTAYMSGYKIFNYKTFELQEVAYQNPSKSRGNIYICHLDKAFDVLIQTKDTTLKSGIVENEREAYIELDVKGTDLESFIENLDKYNIRLNEEIVPLYVLPPEPTMLTVSPSLNKLFTLI